MMELQKQAKTNRQRLVDRIKAGVSRPLAMELDFKLNGVDREDPEPGEASYDMSSAFDEVQDIADTDAGHVCFRSECRKLLIELGYYRVMTQKEIDSIVVTSGKKWDFKMSGVPYTSRDSGALSEWLER